MITNALDKNRKKNFASLLIWRQNLSKLCKQNFAGSLTLLNLSPQKPSLSLGTQISSHRVSKHPQLEGRKSQIWQEVDSNVDVVRDSVRRSLKKSLQRCSQELGLSHVSLQRIFSCTYSESRSNINKLTPADMEFLISVINHYHIDGLHLFWDTL